MTRAVKGDFSVYLNHCIKYEQKFTTLIFGAFVVSNLLNAAEYYDEDNETISLYAILVPVIIIVGLFKTIAYLLDVKKGKITPFDKLSFSVCSLSIIFLLIAVFFSLPYGFYSSLRYVVFSGAILSVIYSLVSFNFHNYKFAILFFILSILYNPMMPIHLGHKLIWIVCNLFTALMFLVILDSVNDKAK